MSSRQATKCVEVGQHVAMPGDQGLLYTSAMTEPGSSGPPVGEDETVVVLAAIDTSSLATRVVDYAAQIARRTWTSVSLHLVHVLRASRFDRPSSVGLSLEDMQADAQNHLDFHVRMARRQYPGPVTGTLATGDPVEEILRTGRSINADLLILGTTDTSGLERLLLGSVASKVAKRAACSVLIVRQKQRPYTKVS